MSVNIGRDKKIGQIVSRLKEIRPSDGPLKISGTWGSFAPMLAGHICSELKRPILYVSAHIDDADNVSDDLAVFTGKAVETFPVWEGQSDGIDATDEISSQRLRITLGLSQAGDEDLSEFIISTCVQALNQPVPSPKLVEQAGLSVSVNQTIEPELIVNWLFDNGFERVDAVDLPGQYAQRGGIIDIFSSVTMRSAKKFSLGGADQAEPVRIEFFGDTVDSIRRIDLDNQRSSEQLQSVSIVGISDKLFEASTEQFVNLLPKDTIVILEEPIDIAEVSNVFLERTEDPRGLYSWKAIDKALENYVRLEISRFGTGADIAVDVSSAQQFEHKGAASWKSNKAILEELLPKNSGKDVLLYCENSAEVDRLKEIIEQINGQVPENFKLPVGFIQQGFILTSLKTVVISHHEIFGQYAVRRRIRTIKNATPVGSLLDLQRGDYVVHIGHGIGKFLGIQTMDKDGTASEYMTIEYAGKVKIYVPVQNISLVHKYIGTMERRPELSRIGSKKWQNQKDKVTSGVQELAAELLEIQAKRKKLGGFAYGQDSLWQKEFEESFLYQETPDQLTVADKIKEDMAKDIPMDRLLCGDVGYGKTELAMRAAFKAVEGGKQVAVLVPTTVLCIQHGRTFTERFADFPVTIEVLNRFVTTKNAKDIIARTRQGKVDILIGTHRLLSKDVGFKDIGLLIIDEEQRFGVEHKERLKKFRVNVDVLTMTATPIPRTLHMSLLGLRDISSLATAPLDRRSIVTRVCRFDKDLVRRAVMNEINRQGQIFFVHNRVQSIEKAAFELSEIIEDKNIRIDIAHGQMPKKELEKAMISFVTSKTDILVCSTIIESGLDIPNANTMIISDADRFGLAQLHQLRGRVGRYKHRAYAYMLLPKSRSITPVAAKRLKAIEEYSQLGAGFRIALRDLQIRGTGNILGPQQSGHIHAVGYELYCRLLAEAVKRLKDEPVEKEPSAVIDLGLPTYIPKSYIPSDRQRMDVYRRIAMAKNTEDLRLLEEELIDLFGKYPQQVSMLIDQTEIRILTCGWGIKSLIARGLDLEFVFDESAAAKDLFARAPGSVRVIDSRTVNIRLTKKYFEPKTLLTVLRRLLSGAVARK
ncbi:MAG: transcription-repair coupling factor [Sedimentisphaerales bacterium]|nr:transcription-repair coupling factor [Sedimentisphaerales bacterium]